MLRLALSRSPIEAPPPRSDRLRVVSWNLRNFPGDHDRARLREQLDALEPQVLAVQEILDPEELPTILPGFRWHASRLGGSHDQHIAIGWNPDEVQVLLPREHPEIGMGGRVRPALSAYVRDRHGTTGFHLVVVHLKATRSGHPVRRQQWPLLRRIVASRARMGPPDDDMVVVGDFNVAGSTGASAQAEMSALEDALAPVGLRPWESVGGCTAYWDGPRRDAWWVPSRLDLVWGRGFAALAPDERKAWPGAHCGRHRCDPLHATPHHPDPDLHGVSDHCPVVIDLPRPRPGPAVASRSR